MFVVTAVLSAVIIGFAQFTSGRVAANETLNFELAVLKALPGIYDSNLSSVELHNIFEQKLTQPTKASGGAFLLKQNDKIVAYALPIEGQGFWAPIKAVIGIKPDKKTVTGFAVYEQRETPGLGAEVAKKEFCDKFNGLKMADGDKYVYFKRPGSELQKCDVHAVTGATQTSTRLEKIINDSIKQWRTKINN